jgi:hypothetical protein
VCECRSQSAVFCRSVVRWPTCAAASGTVRLAHRRGPACGGELPSRVAQQGGGEETAEPPGQSAVAVEWLEGVAFGRVMPAR